MINISNEQAVVTHLEALPLFSIDFNFACTAQSGCAGCAVTAFSSPYCVDRKLLNVEVKQRKKSNFDCAICQITFVLSIAHDRTI